MAKNKFPKMATPDFRRRHGKGWPLNGLNRAQRERVFAGFLAKGGCEAGDRFIPMLPALF